MAVKKATSRKRSTTKRAKTTRTTTTKRATKGKSTFQPPLVDTAAAIELPAREENVHEVASSASDDRPSRCTADYYLHVTGPQPEDGPPRRPGKWLIFVSRSRVDALWDEIRRAVERRRLGYAAKVSTALPNPMSPDPKKHVICVYTHDEDNAADVRRVREALRALGVTWKIPYKSDAATRAGQHEVTTGGPAAKYYE
jgi:hypothetical protein